jgi:hypothetical protein
MTLSIDDFQEQVHKFMQTHHKNSVGHYPSKHFLLEIHPDNVPVLMESEYFWINHEVADEVEMWWKNLKIKQDPSIHQSFASIIPLT